ERMRRAVAAVLGFSEGPALLSRFPIRRWQAYELPRCGRPVDARVLLYAELRTPAGVLAAFSAHTSGDTCQAHAIADLVRIHAGALPAVVMGDFNAPESSPGVRVLTRETGFVDAFAFANPAAPGFTDGQDLTSARPTTTQRIDYVFLAPGRAVAGRVVRTQPSAWGRVRCPSDHYGVLAEVALDAPIASPVADNGTALDVDYRLNAGR